MADIKNNNFKGSIKNNGLSDDIKDVTAGTQDITGLSGMTGYNFPQEIPGINKILRSDGTNLIKWVDAGGIIDTTYNGIINLINSGTLVTGSIYRIKYLAQKTDFYPSSYYEIYLQALSNTQVSSSAQRLMRVPKHSYYYPSLISRGVYDSSKTYSVNDIVIFGGRVYKNLTGNTGSVTYLIMLDIVNWERIEDTDVSFAAINTKYYEDKIYFIQYDIDHAFISSQWDEHNNTVIGERDPEDRLGSLQNTIDVNDWNHPRITDNISYGIWGNPTTNVFYPTSPDFDYAVVRYIWTSAGGIDLDTRTAFIDFPDTLYNVKDLGWNRNGSGEHSLGGSYTGPSESNYYMWWSGDNTGSSGAETVLINFNNIQTDFPSIVELSTRFRAFWYNHRVSGDISFEVTTYKGGTMSKSGFNFINTGGTQVTAFSQTYNLALSGSDDLDGENLGTMLFNTETNTATFVIDNIKEGVITDNNIKGLIYLNDNYRSDEIGNAVYKSIKYNTNKGNINNNTNKGNIIYNDNLGSIYGNIGGYITDFGFPITYGESCCTTDILYNSNNGEISNNLSIGQIGWNSNLGDITTNSISSGNLIGGDVPIIYNSNLGAISHNAVFLSNPFENISGSISYNTNDGSINTNTSYNIYKNSSKGNITGNYNGTTVPFSDPVCNISLNSNNGDILNNNIFSITSNSNDGNISSNVPNTSLSNFVISEVTEGDNISSLTLTGNYTGYNLPQRIGTLGYVLTSDGTNAIWQVSSGGGGGSIAIYDEGSLKTAAATSLNFTGAGVTVTNTGSDVTVSIPLSGSGTNNYLTKWTTGGLTLTNSLIQDDGSTLSVGGLPTSAIKFYITSALDYTGHFQNTSSGKIGLRGETVGVGSSSNVGISAIASGSSTFNYAITGEAIGTSAGTNIGASFTATNGATNYAIKLMDGTQGIGKFLRSITANGNGNWGTINDYTEDTTPDGSADYLMTWDSSTSLHKKVKINNLPSISLSGTSNYVTRWISNSAIGIGSIQDDGSNVSIGAGINPSTKLSIDSNKTYALTVSSSINTLTSQIYSTTVGSAGSNMALQLNAGGSTIGNIGLQIIINGGVLASNNYSLQIIDGTNAAGKFLKSVTSDGKAQWANITAADIAGGVVGGSGTLNYLARWNPNTTTLASSQIYDDGTMVGVNTPGSSTTRMSILETRDGTTSLYVTNQGGGTINYGITASSSGSTATTRIAISGTAYQSSTFNYGVYGIGQGTATGAAIGVYGEASFSSTSNIGGIFIASSGSNKYSVQLKDGTETVANRFLKNFTTDGKANWESSFTIDSNKVAKFDGQIYSALSTTLTPTGTTATLDWNNGNGQVITLASATGNVTLTINNPKSGAVYLLKIIQHASAAKNIIWPSNIKWAGSVTPVITTTLSGVDTIALFYDGTNYYANISQNYG